MFQSVFPLPPTFQKQRWTVSEKGADGLYEPFFKISIGENVDSKAWCHSSYLVDEMTFDLLFPGFTKLLSRYSWSRPFLECKSSPPNLFMCPDDYPKCSPWVVPITSLWSFWHKMPASSVFPGHFGVSGVRICCWSHFFVARSGGRSRKATGNGWFWHPWILKRFWDM